MKRSYFLLCLLGLGACERATTDPSDPSEYATSITQPGKPNTLPLLFNDALLTVQRQQGSEAVDALMAEWESRQAEVRAAHAVGDRNAVQSKLQALQNEEIRVVLKVFGNDIANRVIRDSYEELGAARVRIYEAGREGAQTLGADASTHQIQKLLDRASRIAANDPARALVLATEAATLLSAIDDLIVDLRRVRGLETLFPTAVANLSVEQLTKHARLRREAQLALRDGNRATANEKLAAVRAEEIRIVLNALGNETTGEVLREVGTVIRDTRAKLALLKEAGQDVTRLERMLNSATDLYNRGQRAADAGDHAAALDLGSHAAGLLNSLRHLTAK